MGVDFLPELVEDGTGVQGAVTYLTVANADSLLAGRPQWEGATAEAKMLALGIASAYADARWANLLSVTSVVNPKQGLALPVRGMVAQNGQQLDPLPRQWLFGVALYALAEVGGGVWPKKSTQTANIKSKRVTVGPITTETSFSQTETRSFQEYPEADSLIRSLLRGVFSFGRTLRG